MVLFMAIASTKFCSIIENTSQVNQHGSRTKSFLLHRSFFKMSVFASLSHENPFFMQMCAVSESIRTLPNPGGSLLRTIFISRHF